MKHSNTYDRSKLRAFLPKSSSSIYDIYGEWIRLWHRYKVCMFTYKFFPKKVQTIVKLEQEFEQQKSRFYGRISKKRIGQMILSEDNYHLRFVFCNEKELTTNIWQGVVN